MPFISVEGTDVVVESKPDEPVLTAFNRSGYSYIVGCKRGGCGICLLDIVEGSVHYDKVVAEQVLPENRREEQALSCRAVPDGDVTLRMVEGSKFHCVSPFFAKLAKQTAERKAAAGASS
ncbi:MAG: 2Fe-2S iron-sulfur cluster-binding protein [Actinomycetales bacterium]